MCKNFVIAEDINHEILCRFILFSLLIMSATKMHYMVSHELPMRKELINLYFVVVGEMDKR